ncbi:MAG: hypothetical protein N3D18_04260 [Roseococcus sp.]|nr:hypothetical protein [Roseococcus sp.]
MTRRVIPLPPPAPAEEVRWLVAQLKRHLRRDEVQALAFALVLPGGRIAHGCAGAAAGHAHSLAAGALLIQRDVMRSYEE